MLRCLKHITWGCLHVSDFYGHVNRLSESWLLFNRGIGSSFTPLLHVLIILPCCCSLDTGLLLLKKKNFTSLLKQNPESWCEVTPRDALAIHGVILGTFFLKEKKVRRGGFFIVKFCNPLVNQRFSDASVREASVVSDVKLAPQKHTRDDPEHL